MAAKKIAATRSAADAQLVGWPLPAAVVARIEPIRSRVATSSRDWISPSGTTLIASSLAKPCPRNRLPPTMAHAASGCHDSFADERTIPGVTFREIRYEIEE